MCVVISGILRLTAKAYRDQFSKCYELYEKYSYVGDNPTYTVDGIRGATITLLETQGDFLRALENEFPQGWHADEGDRCAVVEQVKKQNLTGAKMFDNGLFNLARNGINGITVEIALLAGDTCIGLAMCQLVEALYAAGDWWYYDTELWNTDRQPDPLPHIRKLIATNDTRLAALKNTASVEVSGTADTKGDTAAGLAAILGGNVPAAIIQHIRGKYTNAKGKDIAILILALKSAGYFTSGNRTDFYRAFLRDTGRLERIDSFRKGVDKYLNEQGKAASSEWITAAIRTADIAPIVNTLNALK